MIYLYVINDCTFKEMNLEIVYILLFFNVVD